MGMTRKATVSVLLGLAAAAQAGTYYVDANNGNDDWDASSETAAVDVATSKVGPKRTLAEVVKVANASGDVVIALPGVYNDKVSNPDAENSTTELMRRVIIPSGVTLKSKNGPEETFIVGAESPSPDSLGCGVGAIGCVDNNGTLRGFTLTGGRTLATGNGYPSSGGGVCKGTVVDCIISNNACSYRGGGARGSTLYGCRFYGNHAPMAESINAGTAYSCYFADGEVRAATLRGCTVNSGFPNGCSLYNCIVLGAGSSKNNGPKFYRCLYTTVHELDTGEEFNDECVKITASQIKLSDRGVVTNGLELVRDMGNNDYCEGWAAANFFDVVGNGRILNGTTDIGASEYNPVGDFSQLLSHDGAVTVTNASSTVVGLDDAVSVGPAGELSGVLNVSAGAASTMWSFFAEVEGAGTLQVFFGEAAVPSRTLTAGDGLVEVLWTASAPTGIRLAYVGADGSATVSRLSNATTIHITAAYAGVTVSGDCTEPGTYVVNLGETKTVTLARSATATRFVSGLMVNGEFVDFDDYPDGRSFVVDGNVRASALDVEVVYGDSNVWFVDATRGDDGNCGFYMNFAFKTLAKAASVAQSAGDRIVAAPGVYNEGGMYNSAGSNRVIVANGVLLESLGGAAVTTIEGKISEANADGCGPDSMRAVTLVGEAVLKGFTVTKGRSNKPYPGGNENNGNGGGVRGGLVVDCVISNNVAANRGNAATDASLLRCRIGSDPAGLYAAYSGVRLIDCLHDSSLSDYSSIIAYNTTFLQGYLRGTGSRQAEAYNCIFYSAGPESCDMYNCLSAKPIGTSSVNSDSRSKFSVSAADIAYNPATGRPLRDSIALDAGDAGYHAAATNGWSELWRSFVGSDFAGGQRVYNGRIDIGAGEYDWRGEFAGFLAAKGVEVEAAGADVTTNAVSGLDIPSGETLTLRLSIATSGLVSFTVAAESAEAVGVRVDGRAVAAGPGGEVSFAADVGEHSVEIACLHGTATASGFALPKLGMMMIFR